MALAAQPVFCQLKAERPVVERAEQAVAPAEVQNNNRKIVLQPRVCTLRAFGGGRGGVIKAKSSAENDQVSRFFETLSDYIESTKKSHDFEIISGRLAMIVFAATVSMEVVTGNSVFRKMDLQGIAGASAVCLAAITTAAIFAWFSSNRNRVGRIFTISCNTSPQP